LRAAARDTETRDLERRRILAEFDRVYGLPRHADALGERLLRHLGLLETQPANVVADLGARAHVQLPRR
jgi:hypothetical protein